MVLNSPSQTGKGNRFAVDRGDSHAAKLRLYGFELNLALEGKVAAEPTDELHFLKALALV